MFSGEVTGEPPVLRLVQQADAIGTFTDQKLLVRSCVTEFLDATVRPADLDPVHRLSRSESKDEPSLITDLVAVASRELCRLRARPDCDSHDRADRVAVALDPAQLNGKKMARCGRLIHDQRCGGIHVRDREVFQAIAVPI